MFPYGSGTGYDTITVAKYGIDLSGMTYGGISFLWTAEDLEGADYVAFDIYDGTWHYNVRTLTNMRSDIHHTYPIDYIFETVDLSGYQPGNIDIRFRAYLDGDYTEDLVLIDEVVVFWK